MTRVVDGVSQVRRRAPVGLAAPETPSPVLRPVAVARPTGVAGPAKVVRPAPLKRSVVAARLPQGRLDGVRRRPMDQPVASALLRPARTAVTALPRPAAVTPAPQPVMPMADIRPAQPPALPQPLGAPSWRARLGIWRSTTAWRRPMIGFAMVAMAFVAAGLAVRTIAPPKAATAHAEQTVAAAASATPLPAATPQSAALQKLLDDFAAINPGMFSLYVKDLTTGETASVSPDRVMTSASLYKLFVAQRTLAQIDLGQWQQGQAADGGTGRTIDGCLNLMITVSDNGCGRALGAKLGWGSQDQALTVEGYHDTDLAAPQQTSARDVARLFERLYQGTLLSQRSTDEFMNLLKRQQVNNRLPQGLPAGTVIAHKTGDLDGYVHDAGIVYGPKTNYLVVVMSGSWNSPGTAPARFAALSAQLWNHFEQ